MQVEVIAPGTRSARSEGARSRARSPRPMLLVSMAALALLLGALVYLTDRNPSHALLLPNLRVRADGVSFGAWGQWLPSFVHPLAFGLLTAACWSSAAGPRYAACLVWGLVNIAFEVGQHPSFSRLWADALLTGEASGPLMEPLARYFVWGTFDPFDIVAAVLGSLVAAFVLWFSCKAKECNHAS